IQFLTIHFFFFQAEDGIRDGHVTGVQTCALPISLDEFEAAALSLARSGPIKDRLADAYRNHLALVNPEELPAALRAELHACHDALTRERPLPGEDAVRATVRKMSNQDADEVACAVVRLFAAVARATPAERVLAMPEAGSDGASSNGAIPSGAIPNGANGA